jgi:hypothetical protein
VQLELGAGLRSCFRIGDRRSRAGAAVVLTPKWDQRFESGFLQRRVMSEPGRAGYNSTETLTGVAAR